MINLEYSKRNMTIYQPSKIFCRSLIGVDERLQQLKEDMKVLLDARIAAEQDSAKTRAENAVLRKRLDQTQSRTDFLQCSLQKKEAEVSCYREIIK